MKMKRMVITIKTWLFLILGADYAVAGLVLLKVDAGRMGHLFGLFSIGAGLVAVAVSALHRIRVLG